MTQVLFGVKRRCDCMWTVLLVVALAAGVLQADTDYWTGNTFSDDWSRNGNWLDGSRPTSSDSVVFNADDSGNVNVVDINFTIRGYNVTSNSVHTTDLNGSSILQINGPVHIGTVTVASGGDVTWTNGGTVAIGTPTTAQTRNVGTQSL